MNLWVSTPVRRTVQTVRRTDGWVVMTVGELPLLRSENYVTFVAGKLWEDLPQIIIGGLLFSLLAIPAFVLFSLGWVFLTIAVAIVTLIPAWAALLAYEFPLLDDKVARASDFWRALRHFFGRSCLLGAIGAFPLLAAVLKLPMLKQAEIPITLWVSFAADCFAGGLLAALLLYAFPLLVRNDLGVRQALHAAWLLIGRHLLNTVGLLGMVILFAFAVGSISLGLLFFLPAVYGLFVVGNCKLVVHENVK